MFYSCFLVQMWRVLIRGSGSKDYLKALKVTYHFLSKPLIEMAKCHLDPKKPSICCSAARSWCPHSLLRLLLRKDEARNVATWP